MTNNDKSREDALKDLRSTLNWLEDDVRYLDAEVDPVLEATAINKAFDDGPVFVAKNVTDFPDARLIASLWGRRDRLHRMMGVDSPREAALKVIDAVKNPITPVKVAEAPCQEIVEIGAAANASVIVKWPAVAKQATAKSMINSTQVGVTQFKNAKGASPIVT